MIEEISNIMLYIKYALKFLADLCVFVYRTDAHISNQNSSLIWLFIIKIPEMIKYQLLVAQVKCNPI